MLPTLGHYRHDHDVQSVLVRCLNHRCVHRAVLRLDHLSDDTVLKSLEPRMVCTACGHVGGDVRPNWEPVGTSNVPLTYMRRSD